MMGNGNYFDKMLRLIWMQITENEIILENRERNETNTIYKLTGTQWHGSWLVSDVMFSITISNSV